MIFHNIRKYWKHYLLHIIFQDRQQLDRLKRASNGGIGVKTMLKNAIINALVRRSILIRKIEYFYSSRDEDQILTMKIISNNIVIRLLSSLQKGVNHPAEHDSPSLLPWIIAILRNQKYSVIPKWNDENYKSTNINNFPLCIWHYNIKFRSTRQSIKLENNRWSSVLAFMKHCHLHSYSVDIYKINCIKF